MTVEIYSLIELKRESCILRLASLICLSFLCLSVVSPLQCQTNLRDYFSPLVVCLSRDSCVCSHLENYCSFQKTCMESFPCRECYEMASINCLSYVGSGTTVIQRHEWNMWAQLTFEKYFWVLYIGLMLICDLFFIPYNGSFHFAFNKKCAGLYLRRQIESGFSLWSELLK